MPHAVSTVVENGTHPSATPAISLGTTILSLSISGRKDLGDFVIDLPFVDGETKVAAVLAITSAVLQVSGYVIYIRRSLTSEIDPNPITWLMFSYGTTLLTIIEYESGASWRELALPVACSAGSLAVAMICGIRGKMRWPHTKLEIGAFVADVGITLAYVAFWWRSRSLIDGGDGKEIYDLGFIAASNATAFTAFIPILASTRLEPENERALPWIIWALAYAVLLGATLASVSGYRNAELLLYPLINFTLHAVVALLICSGVWAAREKMNRDLYVGPTAKTGNGLFAKRAFVAGELVFRMTGKQMSYAITTEEESMKFENWLGIGRDCYLLPDKPYIFANHSCEPNLGVRGELDFVALHHIAADEELTFDYSITTEETTWRMLCLCGRVGCRGEIAGIQTLPTSTFLRYLPFINPYFQSAYRAKGLLNTGDPGRI